MLASLLFNNRPIFLMRLICNLALLCSLLLIVSCSTVRFNEREHLAREDMQFDSRPLASEIESHIYQAREGASGVFSGGGGGGCGCY